MRLKKVLIIVLAVIIPFLIILGALRLTVFNIESKSDVENKDMIVSDLVYFLKDRGGDISSFEQVEQEHLVEVRDVIQRALFFFNFILILFVIFIGRLYYLDKKNFLKNAGVSLFYGGITATGAVVLLFLLALNFDSLFAGFHNLFFATQWQFPADYLLIRLFPQQFFVDVFRKILTGSLVAGLVVGGIGYFLEKYLSKAEKNK